VTECGGRQAESMVPLAFVISRWAGAGHFVNGRKPRDSTTNRLGVGRLLEPRSEENKSNGAFCRIGSSREYPNFRQRPWLSRHGADEAATGVRKTTITFVSFAAREFAISRDTMSATAVDVIAVGRARASEASRRATRGNARRIVPTAERSHCPSQCAPVATQSTLCPGKEASLS